MTVILFYFVRFFVSLFGFYFERISMVSNFNFKLRNIKENDREILYINTVDILFYQTSSEKNHFYLKLRKVN